MKKPEKSCSFYEFFKKLRNQIGAFQVKIKIRGQLDKSKGQIHRRLKRAAKKGDGKRPVLSSKGIQYEISLRTRGMAYGGLGATHQVALQSGLVNSIDLRLKVLKQHQPYYESDHVLNIAYNILCGGQTLEDIELRRNDEVYLDALGAASIPDPTTAGDFCRRFTENDIHDLMDAINDARVRTWKQQGPEFFSKTARIDGDGTFVGTTGECKEGMALSYKGGWGYHPLLISLANTAEPLFIVNRGGSRPSAEGAAAYYDKAITLCRQGGFSDILLRGDTDFSQTRELDRWSDDGVRFVFGYDAVQTLKGKATELNDDDYNVLVRRAEVLFDKSKRRQKQPCIKEDIVREKGYKNIRLRSEDIAEFDYQPTACDRAHRMVVVRKNLSVERGEQVLFDEIRYFFYITNDRELSVEEVVFESNNRCDQENLIAQLKSGARAFHAPVNTLNANWAYMVMASLAWTLKAWMALYLPITPRWKKKHLAEQERWLRMEFRTFLNEVIHVPVQIVTTGRRLVYRLLAWRPQLPTFFRLIYALPSIRASA